MKKILYFLVLAFIFLPGLAFAAEKIDKFTSSISINPDASVAVMEKIEYNFGDAQKHGIFREIPTVYKTDSGKRKIKFSKISVTVVPENSEAYTPNFEISYPSGKIYIKIGDPDILIGGRQQYAINYTVNGVIDYFSDHDELNWNVTGNGWGVPIEGVEAVFGLPTPLLPGLASADCYVGWAGSKELCANKLFFTHNSPYELGVQFNHDGLSPHAGLTGVLGFPKGLVAAPGKFDKYLNLVADYWPLVLPLIAFVVMFYLWWTRGRDPEGRGTIIPEYDVPDNLTPIELGTVYDNKPTSRDITAEIIYLATRGYLKINRLETEKSFGRKEVDYEIEKLKEVDSELADFDRSLFLALFKGVSVVKISTLKDKFYQDYTKIIVKVWEAVVSNSYYAKNSNNIKIKYISVAMLIVVFGFLGIVLGAVWTRSIIAAGLFVFFFGIIMPARTRKGVLAKEHILGLKMYLSVAEKDRLAFHNAPEKSPALFDKFLPYAIALGVETAWAGQFAGIYNQPPNWYNGGVGHNFSVGILASDLSNFNSHGVGNIVMAPTRSSGSGLRGGGFSGGGFGGGGGGSW